MIISLEENNWPSNAGHLLSAAPSPLPSSTFSILGIPPPEWSGNKIMGTEEFEVQH